MLAALKEALSEEQKLFIQCILGVFLILIFMLSDSRFFCLPSLQEHHNALQALSQPA